MSALPTAVRRPQVTAAPDRRPQLRVVQKPRRTWPFLLAIVVVVVGGVFGILSLSALAAESAFAARELSAEIEALSIRYDELTAEVAHLESPERVRNVAMTQLGMVEAERPAFLMVSRPAVVTPTAEGDEEQPPPNPHKSSANPQAASAGD